MKLKFEKNKGQRINHKFRFMSSYVLGWWYNTELKQWEYKPEHGVYTMSSSKFCKSIKSFRRNLKKAPFGVKFYLASNYIGGYDVDGFGQCPLIKPTYK